VPPPEGGDPPVRNLILRRPRRNTVLATLVGVFVVLAAVDAVAVSLGKDTAARLVSLDAETTIGTWWASAQLMALAVLFAIVGVREEKEGRTAAVVALRLSAVVAVFLSVDETAGIHELLAKRFGRGPLPVIGDGFDTWFVIYSVVAVIVLVVSIPGILSLLRTDRIALAWLGVGAALLVLGGVVVDHLHHPATPTVWDVIFEESFEYIGVAVMIWAAYRMIEGLTLEAPDRADRLGSVQRGDAELVALGIGEDGPVEARDLVILHPRPAEFLDPRHERLRILMGEVEVEAVLDDLVLGNLLE